MNKIFFTIGIIVVLASCSKDIGNYSYHDINEITINGFNTATGYQVLYGDVLAITPTLEMTMDKNPAVENYSYEWSLRLPGKQGTGGYPARDTILSVEKNLSLQVSLPPGPYTLQYKVTDKATGVRFQARAALMVTTDVYEGFMVLNNVSGHSRLDMITATKNPADSFVQYTDVLNKMGSTVPMDGEPYQVMCMLWTRSNIDPLNFGIFILNGSGTNRIQQESFAYNPLLNIRYFMLGEGPVPADFRAERLTGQFSGTTNIAYLMYGKDGNMYGFSTSAGYIFKYSPLNIYKVGEAPFRVSKYAATDGSTALMYDMDARQFVTLAAYANPIVTKVAVNFNYPSGYDLVYMEKDYNNKVLAVLKDPVTSKLYILRIRYNAAFNTASGDYFQEITGTDINSATNFTMSPELGYLFYSVGGKVYEYDPALRTSILMVDKGAQEISYLNFQFFYNRLTAKANQNYKTWCNWLIVGSYNPSGVAGANGQLEFYSVPPVNGQIVKKNSWSGFGKIVSISYRERDVW